MNPLLADSLTHVKDKFFISEQISDLGEIGNITIQTTALVVSFFVLMVVMFSVARRVKTGSDSEGNQRYITKGRIAQIVEVIMLYLRDQLIEPVLGEKQTRKYMPFLMSLFFFILTVNLFGMIPLEDFQNLIGHYAGWGNHWSIIGGTATSNIYVTLMLAVVSFVMIQIHSFRELGFLGWLDHLTCGLLKGPKGLWLVVPVIFAVELAGVFIKPLALAIRLFANMLGGHILLATLLLLPTTLQQQMGLNGLFTGGITVVSGTFAVLITFLEFFVAFLQAFIFMFLTAVFISLMSHEEHDEEHASDHAESEGHAAPAH